MLPHKARICTAKNLPYPCIYFSIIYIFVFLTITTRRIGSKVVRYEVFSISYTARKAFLFRISRRTRAWLYFSVCTTMAGSPTDRPVAVGETKENCPDVWPLGRVSGFFIRKLVNGRLKSKSFFLFFYSINR